MKRHRRFVNEHDDATEYPRTCFGERVLDASSIVDGDWMHAFSEGNLDSSQHAYILRFERSSSHIINGTQFHERIGRGRIMRAALRGYRHFASFSQSVWGASHDAR